MNKSTAFVVLSCDKYSDLWLMYLKLFDRFWPDCPYDKFFVTNEKSIIYPGFSNIKIAENLTWSEGLLEVIDRLKQNYEYVLITLEDLPLIQTVNQKKIEFIFDLFFKANGDYLSLVSKLRVSRKLNSCFGYISKDSLYRPTCVYALWKIKVLKSLIVSTENAWEFEKLGAKRSINYNHFFTVLKDEIRYSNTVVKGKWVRSEYNRIKKLDSTDIFDYSREKFSLLDEFKLKIYKFFFQFFVKHLPLSDKLKTCFLRLIKRR